MLEHAHDVGLLHDEELLAVDLDLGAGPLAEQDAVARLHVDGDELAGFVAGARADGDDLAFLRLLLGGVGNDDAALGLVFAFDAADDDAVVQRPEFHGGFLGIGLQHSGRASLALAMPECYSFQMGRMGKENKLGRHRRERGQAETGGRAGRPRLAGESFG